MLRPLTIIIAISIATSADSDDYKHITDAAYCSGVVSRNIDLMKRDLGAVAPGDPQNLLRFHAIVQGALKLNKIDASTTTRLILVGQQDAELCWDTSMRCMNEGLQNKTADPNKTLANCMLQSEHVCKRIVSCN